MVGNELAVAAFIHPAIGRLRPPAHAAAAKAIASILGRVMPFWYGLGLLALLAELWRHHHQPHPFRLLLLAAVLWAATIVFTLAALVPRNDRIAAMDPDRPYPTWQVDRSQWDTIHRVRVAVLCVAFALLAFALLTAR